MTDHPLTDELCKELSVYPIEEFAAQIADGTMTDMRAAADWQLEQVMKWLNATIFEDNMFFEGSMLSSDIDCLPRRLQEAMRPQEITE